MTIEINELTRIAIALERIAACLEESERPAEGVKETVTAVIEPCVAVEKAVAKDKDIIMAMPWAAITVANGGKIMVSEEEMERREGESEGDWCDRVKFTHLSRVEEEAVEKPKKKKPLGKTKKKVVEEEEPVAEEEPATEGKKGSLMAAMLDDDDDDVLPWEEEPKKEEPADAVEDDEDLDDWL